MRPTTQKITAPKPPGKLVILKSPKQYNAANDNVPYVGDVPGENQRCEGWQPARGQYIGLTRPSSSDSGRSSHLEKTPEERLPQTLRALAALPGYVYLGSAYSKYEAGHDAASRVAAEAAAKLMTAGLCIFAPIPHGHTITLAGDLPKDWAFWKRQCDPMLAAASALIVLTMTGWHESVGLQYEIGSFLVANKPILHVSPAELATFDALMSAREVA